MKSVRLVLTSVTCTLAVCATLYGAWQVAFSKSPQKEKHAPTSGAKLNKVNEDELDVIELSAEAEEHIGIKSSVVEKKTLSKTRTYGGEVMVPTGRTILVSAPMQGILQAAEGKAPEPGDVVKKGQPIISLLPLFSPEASTTLSATRADVEGQVKNAETQFEVTKLAMERAQKLFRDEAGSKRAVEEAQAQHDLAARTLDAANLRLKILDKAVGATAKGVSEAIHLEAPEDGILRNVMALPGQSVPNGGALFEVVDLKEVWIRVPVYVGDLKDIANGETAQVGELSMQAGDRTWPAVSIKAPPSANPLSSTVDLFYFLSNSDAQFTPGQRVSVKARLSSSGESLTVPWSSIVHDLNGGAWIYESLGSRRFRRIRVVVRYSLDGLAVLASGPALGTNVVTEGAIELFGAETGFSK